MKLTQKIVKEYVEILGGKLKRNAEFDEYVLKTGRPEEDYFCNDLTDVVETARCMFGTSDKFENAEEYLKGIGVTL